MVKINLLPLKVKKSNVALRLYTYVVMGAALLVLIMVLVLVGLVGGARHAGKALAAVEAKRQAIADKIKPINALLDQEKEVMNRKQLIYNLSLNQGVWVTILSRLAAQVTNDMWLSTLSATPEGKEQALQINIEGFAYHKISVADFLANLEKTDIFTNVKLEGLSDKNDPAMKSVQFKISMTYKGYITATAGGGQ